jgi:glycerol kinase
MNITFVIFWIAESPELQTDSGVKLLALKVGEGMLFNELLTQFQADILDAPVIRPKVAETTALGTA